MTFATKGKLCYFSIAESVAEVNAVDMDLHWFDYDLDNMEDTYNRFMDVTDAVMNKADKIMKGFNMWGPSFDNTVMLNVINKIRQYSETK